MGNAGLRSLLVVGATSVLRQTRSNDKALPWMCVLLARRPYKVVAIALANKMARIIWALLATGEGLSRRDPGRFPGGNVQTGSVHLLRHSLDFVSYKDRKPLAAALKMIYRAVDAEAGEAELPAFEKGLWGRRYPID